MKITLYYIKQAIVILLTVFSLSEVVFEWLPIGESPQVKIFFMGLTLIGAFYEIISWMMFDYFKKNNLSAEIERGLILSKDNNRFDSSVLLDIESNLSLKLNGDASTEYRVIIITACLELHETPYINTIWNNITNDCKYLYITPSKDQDFINALVYIFSSIRTESLNVIYETVTKNISHICDEKIFDILPKSYDLCIYFGEKNKRADLNNAKGFVCYQKAGNREDDHMFYQSLARDNISSIINVYLRQFNAEKIMEPYISKKVMQKKSGIHGQGLFSNQIINKGEIVFIKGGHLLHRDEMYSACSIDSYLPIDDDLFLSAKTEEEAKYVKLFINHSCEPNLGIMSDGRTFYAMRSIRSGEELTIDYAFVDNEDYVFECHCGSPKCRQTITGYDWKREDFQKLYLKYFSPYLRKKIIK